MKRIGIINQRYGLEVNGGSEYYTRIMAEHLKDRYAIEVLTTTALDSQTWENHYQEGMEEINGILVRRFSVDQTRAVKAFRRELEQGVFFPGTEREELEWIKKQGPVCTKLVNYVKEHEREYDAFVVVTYLYYPTIHALPIVGKKAVFIPTAHEEPFIHFQIFNKLFALPKAFVFLTQEERALVQNLFPVEHIANDVMGVGIEKPANISADSFRRKYNLQGEYLIYVGRIEESKGCAEMFSHFIKYKRRHRKSKLKLVLMGKAAMKIPIRRDILNCGFVTEEEKFSGIAGAKALIQPSHFESLSIVLLEAMSLGVPVIVSEHCDVMRGHCIKSNAGLYFGDYQDFAGIVDYLATHPEEYRTMQRNAVRYVDTYYNWEHIIDRFATILEYVSS